MNLSVDNESAGIVLENEVSLGVFNLLQKVRGCHSLYHPIARFPPAFRAFSEQVIHD